MPRKSSHLYFIREVGTSYVKIGISSDPDGRLGDLQTGTPHDLFLEYSIGPFRPPSAAGKWEEKLHRHLKSRHVRGEWYWLSEDEVEELIREIGWIE
jgi:hypothetical protein